MKKYISILIITTALGCRADFLELENPNALTVDNFPTSIEGMDQMMEGVYGNMHSFGLYGHNMMVKNTFCWDHTQNMGWQGTQTWIALCQNDTNPSDAFLAETWRDSYKGIQRANTMLEVVEQHRNDESSSIPLDILTDYEGQAHYLRAWFYFNLISIYGEKFIIDGEGRDAKGVPIFRQAATSTTDAAVGRSSVGEVWDFIIEDLKRAEEILVGVSRSGAVAHRAGEWSVKAFLGKVYAYTDDWQSARVYLQDVIDNSGRSLVSFDVYKDMFNGKHEFNAESLIEIPLTIDVAGEDDDDLTTGSWMGMVMAPSWSDQGGSPVGSGWSNVYPHEMNLRRFGYNIPHYFTSSVSVPNASNVRTGYIEESLQARANKSVDPRLWVSLLQPYVDSMTVNGVRRAISHFHDGVEINRSAWSFRKYVHLENNQRAVRNSGENIIWMRLADVYLLYAEALIETGNPQLGLEYLNKVKRRAYGYDLDSPSPADYRTLTDKTMADDPVLGHNPLRYERFAELFAEGHKWFDMRRWQIGAEEAAYYQNVRGGSINWQDTDYAQPIPTLELETNPAIDFSDQNPGYF